MLNDLVVYVFIGILIYGVIVAMRDGFLKGFLAVGKILLKISYWCTIGVPILFFKGLLDTVRDDKVVGVEKETIAITDSYRDKKGRLVKINKTIDVNKKAVTDRYINKIR